MPDQELYPVSITEPWPRQRNRWLIVASVVGFVAALLAVKVDYSQLDPVGVQHKVGGERCKSLI